VAICRVICSMLITSACPALYTPFCRIRLPEPCSPAKMLLRPRRFSISQNQNSFVAQSPSEFRHTSYHFPYHSRSGIRGNTDRFRAIARTTHVRRNGPRCPRPDMTHSSMQTTITLHL
jgi:hypothetical protein